MLFNLRRPGGRIDVDAFDKFDNPYELKTTSKGGVSTARDLGYNHLDKWAKRYWIIVDFKKTIDSHDFINFWFMAPRHLQGWFDKIRARLDLDREITERAEKSMRLGGASDEDIRRVLKLCSDGALLNDPNIPKGYVRKHALPLMGDMEQHLYTMVQQFPLSI